jgi:exopolysaccharide production protein ExoQ
MSASPEDTIKPVGSLAITWLLMPCLAFFAISGHLRFNNSVDAELGAALITGAAGGAGNANAKLISILLLGLVGLLVLGRLTKVVSIGRNHWVFLALCGWAFVTSLWSAAPKHSALNAAYVTVNVLFAFYLSVRFKPLDQFRILQLAGWIVIVMSISVCCIIPRYGISNTEAGAIGAWTGIFQHKNQCAVMVSYLLPIAFFVPTAGQMARIYKAVYVSLAIWLILMSQSRTGWLLVAVSLAYVGFLKLTSKFAPRDRTVVSAAAIVAVATVCILGAVYFQSILLILHKDPTLTGRTDIWTAALGSAAKHPIIGYGYTAFLVAAESVNMRAALRGVNNAIDNGYLVMWLELGGVGVALFCISLIRALRNSAVCLARGGRPYAGFWVLIILMTIITNVGEAEMMGQNHLTWIMYVMACIGLSAEARRIRNQGAHDSLAS